MGPQPRTSSHRPGDAAPDEAPDVELVRRARAGEEPALAELLRRYTGLVRRAARPYFLPGAESQDLVQEALIGLYEAVRDFDPDRSPSFRAFAELCATRQVVSAVRRAGRHKHAALNDYLPVAAGGRRREALGAAAADPADLFEARERLTAVLGVLSGSLSPLEQEVLRLHLQGESYTVIAARVHREPKAVDNALQRVRRKLERSLRAVEDPGPDWGAATLEAPARRRGAVR